MGAALTPDKSPWKPAVYDEEIIYAIRALAEGSATQLQQITAWQYIQFLAGSGDFEDLSFRPGGEDGRRETDFAEGKRFVGLQLRKMLSSAVTPKAKQQKDNEDRERRATRRPRRTK